MRKLVSLLLLTTILLGTAVGLTSCDSPGTMCGDFVYKVIEDTKTAKITGLSDSGQEKEILIVPETIDGYPVAEIGTIRHGFWGNFHSFSASDKLRRLYLPYPVKIVYVPGGDVKTFYLPGEYDEDSEMGMAYCNPYRHGLTDFSEKTSERLRVTCADVVYFYNYDGAPEDGCYWIDDYDNERIAYPPQDPVREGFRFTGWFKESECFTPWNFEKDVLPQKYYPASYYGESTKFRITHLYAGWERVN